MWLLMNVQIMKECKSTVCENIIAIYYERQYEIDGVAWTHLYKDVIKGENYRELWWAPCKFKVVEDMNALATTPHIWLYVCLAL